MEERLWPAKQNETPPPGSGDVVRKKIASSKQHHNGEREGGCTDETRAHELIASGRLEDADALLDSCLAKDANCRAALSGKCAIALQRNSFEAATQWLVLELLCNPDAKVRRYKLLADLLTNRTVAVTDERLDLLGLAEFLYRDDMELLTLARNAVRVRLSQL